MLTLETYSTPKARFRTREYRNLCLLWGISTLLMEQSRIFRHVGNIICMFLIYALFNKAAGFSKAINLA